MEVLLGLACRVSIVFILLCGWLGAGDDPEKMAPRSAFVNDILEQAPKLRPEVLNLAVEAFGNAKAANLVKRARLTIIDYALPSYQKRLWVIDMDQELVLREEWVAHGMGLPRGSGGDMVWAKAFSNQVGSLMSSLGLFLTGETYYGKHGYSLRLDGLEPGFNDAARERLIVLHGASYVTPERASRHEIGRSWGCPVVRDEVSADLIDDIKNGSVLWVHYPDENWLSTSRFLGAK